jgi:3',5'-cyclic-AMP phosphodiesterase
MSELDRERREIAATLQQPGLDPDPKLRITRRTFVHRSCVAGAATVAQTFGWWPLINTIDMAYAAEPPFKFAWISDTHLYPESVNTRFVEKVKRAAKEAQDMSPPADFLIFGGDLAQLGRANELALGVQLLSEVKVRKVFIPGEHDWYYDMGKEWMRLFDKPNWTFDHKGVRFVGLDTVTRAPDYWSARKMSPEERMDYIADLDGSVAGPWAGVGRDQLNWLSNWDKSRPIVIFSHNPLYEYYPPWNFWVRDWPTLTRS